MLKITPYMPGTVPAGEPQSTGQIHPSGHLSRHPQTVRLMTMIRARVARSDQQNTARLDAIYARQRTRRARLLKLPTRVIEWLHPVPADPRPPRRLMDGLKKNTGKQKRKSNRLTQENFQ